MASRLKWNPAVRGRGEVTARSGFRAFIQPAGSGKWRWEVKPVGYEVIDPTRSIGSGMASSRASAKTAAARLLLVQPDPLKIGQSSAAKGRSSKRKWEVFPRGGSKLVVTSKEAAIEEARAHASQAEQIRSALRLYRDRGELDSLSLGQARENLARARYDWDEFTKGVVREFLAEERERIGAVDAASTLSGARTRHVGHRSGELAEMQGMLSRAGYDPVHALQLVGEGMGPEELRVILAIPSGVGSLPYTHGFSKTASSGKPAAELEREARALAGGRRAR